MNNGTLGSIVLGNTKSQLLDDFDKLDTSEVVNKHNASLLQPFPDESVIVTLIYFLHMFWTCSVQYTSC